MNRKSKKRLIEVYDVDLELTYVPGDSNSLGRALNTLGDEIIEVITHNNELNEEELDVIADELRMLISQFDSFRERYLGSRWARLSTNMQLSGEISSKEDTENEDDWDKVASIVVPAYKTENDRFEFAGNDWQRDLVLGMTYMLNMSREISNNSKVVKQIHLTEYHLLIMKYLGVKFVNPRNSISGFPKFINDVHYLRIIQRPSEYFLREPIRGYRNLETSGVVESIKAASREDPKKIIDFYGFVQPSGEAIAIRDLRDIGIKELDSLQSFTNALFNLYPEQVYKLQQSSAYAESRSEVLDV